ncbi:MAG: tmk, partial [Paenibacillaceae bacterium]|nr:tmk [Paenibacillaceae bacterium]
EGAGKTSLIPEIEAILKELGREVLITREPGGIRIAEEIRSIILNKEHTSMDGRTEALLYAAARRQHLVEKVLPAIARGATVLSDRYVDSSLVYQGHARGLGIDEIYAVNEFATGGVMPDLTLWLDIDPEVGLSRIHQDKDREINRLDLEGRSFHNKVREGYAILHSRYPERIVRIDAGQPFDLVLQSVSQALKLCFQAGKRRFHVK